MQQQVRNNYEAMTMFAGVCFTNLTFGKPTLDPKDPQFWQKLVGQLSLVAEELKETAEAMAAQDMRGVRDGVSDLLVTAMGIAHLAGFDVEDDMKQVLKSNMSKVCPNLVDANNTSQKYWDIGVNTKIEQCKTVPGGYIVKVDGDQTGEDGKFYPDNKFLKSVGNFKEPVFFWPEEEEEAAAA